VEDHQELVHMGLYLGRAESRHKLPPLLSGQLVLPVLDLFRRRNMVDIISCFIRTKRDYWNDFITVCFTCIHTLLHKIA
jgi:hypothetical protein